MCLSRTFSSNFLLNITFVFGFQVFLDFELVQTIDAMKPNQHFIEERELWEVKIPVNGGKKVNLLTYTHSILLTQTHTHTHTHTNTHTHARTNTHTHTHTHTLTIVFI